MATATLELINPYSKLGLKRRPTYDEIIGLINENETITGKLPDRTATFYKASPEGSFFDGSDALEILKEQQNRIMEREMRDLLMRRNVRMNGGTFSVARSTSNSSIPQTASEGLTSDGESLRSASIQTELQDRARRAIERSQQTGEEYRRNLPRLPNIFGMSPTSPQTIRGTATPQSIPLTPQTIRGTATPASLPSPQRTRRQPEEIFIGSEGSDEAELMTAREIEEPQPKEKSKPQRRINLDNITYSINLERLNEDELFFQLFIRGRDMSEPENSLENLRRKGKGKGLTTSQYYRQTAQRMINEGTWQRRIEEVMLQKRIKEYKSRDRPRGSKD